MIHQYLHNNKIPDETCQPYEAKTMECIPANVCRNCAPGGLPGFANDTCYAVHSYTGYGVGDYGHVKGELDMMKEIYARGPLVCSAACDDEFLLNFSQNAQRHEGVFVTDKIFNESQVDHNIEVVGWGETASGVKYWVARNSWGTYWGDLGWFKVKRGVNQMLIEADCDWAVPTFKDLDLALHGQVMGDYIRGVQPIDAAVFSPTAGAFSLAGQAGATAGSSSGFGIVVLAAASGFVTALALLHLPQLRRSRLQREIPALRPLLPPEA